VGVVDDLIEQLVHRLEVLAAHMPVRLLAVDRQGGEIRDDRAEELRDSGGDIRVG
jgi:hypothetical protein